MGPGQFLEGPQEGVLQQVLGILRAAGQPQERGVESILVAPDQLAERLGLARPTGSDELVVVTNSRHYNP